MPSSVTCVLGPFAPSSAGLRPIHLPVQMLLGGLAALELGEGGRCVG